MQTHMQPRPNGNVPVLSLDEKNYKHFAGNIGVNSAQKGAAGLQERRKTIPYPSRLRRRATRGCNTTGKVMLHFSGFNGISAVSPGGSKMKTSYTHGVIGALPMKSWSKRRKRCPVFAQTANRDSSSTALRWVLIFCGCLGRLGLTERSVISIP
jgi:hypothetical protein